MQVWAFRITAAAIIHLLEAWVASRFYAGATLGTTTLAATVASALLLVIQLWGKSAGTCVEVVGITALGHAASLNSHLGSVNSVVLGNLLSSVLVDGKPRFWLPREIGQRFVPHFA